MTKQSKALESRSTRHFVLMLAPMLAIAAIATPALGARLAFGETMEQIVAGVLAQEAARGAADGASDAIEAASARAFDEDACTCPANACASRVGPGVEGSPDLNTWLARVATDGLTNNGAGDYHNRIASSTFEPQYMAMAEASLGDPASLLSSAFWQALGDGTSANMKSVYEAIIMGYLSYDAYDTGGTGPFDPAAYNDLLVELNGLDSDLVGDALEDLGLDNPHKGLADGIDIANMIASDVVGPAVDAYVSRTLATNAARERIYLLEGMRSVVLRSSSPDADLLAAIDEIVACYYRAADEFYLSQAAGAAQKFGWDTVMFALSEANPVFKGVGVAKAALDAVLGYGSQAEMNLRLATLYVVGTYADSAMRDAYSTYLPYRYKGDEQERAAAAGFTGTYYGYLEFSLYATSFAKDWVGHVQDSPLQFVRDLITGGGSSSNAQAVREVCDNDAKRFSNGLKLLADYTDTYLAFYSKDCERCGCNAKVPVVSQEADDGDAAAEAAFPENDVAEQSPVDEPDDVPAGGRDLADGLEIPAGLEDHGYDGEDSLYVLRDAGGNDVVIVRLAPGYDYYGTLSEEHRYVYEKSYSDNPTGVMVMLHYTELTPEEYFEAYDDQFAGDDSDREVVEQQGYLNGLSVVWHEIVDRSEGGRTVAYYSWVTDGVHNVSVEYFISDEPEDVMTTQLFLEVINRIEFL